MIINLTDSEFDILFSYSEDFRKRVRLACRAPKECSNELLFVQSEIRRQFPNDKIAAIRWFRQYCSDTGENFGFNLYGNKYPGLADSKHFVEQALQK